MLGDSREEVLPHPRTASLRRRLASIQVLELGVGGSDRDGIRRMASRDHQHSLKETTAKRGRRRGSAST
uniref:Uncharacterized protein n=1 Tax=Oryza meridionalis TaxID=40149 RepID=A0A0E0D9E4_9ORYZ